MIQVDCLKDPNLAIYQQVVQTDLLRKIVIFKDLSEKSLAIIEKRIHTLELKKGKRSFLKRKWPRGFISFILVQ
ncbi:hypothetical protein [Bacillus sp. X1(2014)]|uniref:hypothetical protein n=1 Tax=Bacillus sp. X1(2014) TaxID=1565991 RepID=UPI0021B294A9|nr:hypothetical protein [Bacillus sp. X1(2014)]